MVLILDHYFDNIYLLIFLTILRLIFYYSIKYLFSSSQEKNIKRLKKNLNLKKQQHKLKLIAV